MYLKSEKGEGHYLADLFYGGGYSEHNPPRSTRDHCVCMCACDITCTIQYIQCKRHRKELKAPMGHCHSRF